MFKITVSFAHKNKDWTDQKDKYKGLFRKWDVLFLIILTVNQRERVFGSGTG